MAPDAPQPDLPPADVPLRVVRDDLLHEGPLVATSVGLRAATRPFALVAAGDMPGLRPEVLRLLAGRTATGCEAAALVDGDRWRPLPSLLEVAPAIRSARRLVESGERRLRALVGDLRLETVAEVEWRVADPAGDWRRDVDLPSDLPEASGG